MLISPITVLGRWRRLNRSSTLWADLQIPGWKRPAGTPEVDLKRGSESWHCSNGCVIQYLEAHPFLKRSDDGRMPHSCRWRQQKHVAFNVQWEKKRTAKTEGGGNFTVRRRHQQQQQQLLLYLLFFMISWGDEIGQWKAMQHHQWQRRIPQDHKRAAHACINKSPMHSAARKEWEMCVTPTSSDGCLNLQNRGAPLDWLSRGSKTFSQFLIRDTFFRYLWCIPHTRVLQRHTIKINSVHF